MPTTDLNSERLAELRTELTNGRMLLGGVAVEMIDEIERLRKEIEYANAYIDGVDFLEGHARDNTTPDQLRAIVLGMALAGRQQAARIAELEVEIARLKAPPATVLAPVFPIQEDDS